MGLLFILAASVGSFAITVQNEGQNEINVTVKEPPIIDIDKKPLHLANGAFGQVCNLVFLQDPLQVSLNTQVLHIVVN
jgi:hypothetical protein